MAWNYGDLKTEISKEVDDDTTDALTVIGQLINDVCEDIWYYATWSFRSTSTQFNSVSGTASYDLSSEISDLNKILTVGYKGENDTEFRLIREIDMQTYNAISSDTNTSTPSRFAYYNNNLLLDPIPNYSGTNNIEVYYDKIFTTLSSDSDVPEIPSKYKRVVKSGVKTLFWNYDDDLRETIEERRYKGGLGWMMENDMDRTIPPQSGKLIVAGTPRSRRYNR